MDKNIQKAIAVLNSGGVVVFPTDTAFGIGCRIDNEVAIKRLFEIRKRPLKQAAPVLIDSIEMAKDYLKPIQKEVKEKLMEKYWPGALTIILSCIQEKVPSLVRGGGSTLGVRIPRHEVPIALIKGTGVPILGPSANFHGLPTPFAFEDLDPELIKLVDYCVFGKTSLGKASTVIDCSVNPWKVQREGGIKIDI